MAYIPTTDSERDAMLNAIGIDSVETLFDVVPEAFSFVVPGMCPAG